MSRESGGLRGWRQPEVYHLGSEPKSAVVVPDFRAAQVGVNEPPPRGPPKILHPEASGCNIPKLWNHSELAALTASAYLAPPGGLTERRASDTGLAASC
ncbi:Hypothetical predicted protein [Marmota monax]|uniref:Uncharacterized protein n=1 Tax=Marmota monax TaxID=9995 RepID=A0A5E4DDK3_MARMO|nr:hypothetical protein GHT09_016154 [Marmota monax]VTJ90869.1 Hypothetical predicted protein [Marmota monax]